MARIKFKLSGPRPFFAEVPYYLWGQVNYDSEGNCERPTDREWTELRLKNRTTKEILEISGSGEQWSVTGADQLAARAERFLLERSGTLNSSRATSKDENFLRGMRRAEAVAKEFSAIELQPFDMHLFWGSWKWVGWYSTDFASAGRLIMHSLVRRDPRAIFLCVDWLKQGTYSPKQSAALREALRLLTGESFESNRQWIKWYEGGLFSRGNRARFPAPEYESWLAEMKVETAKMLGESGA